MSWQFGRKLRSPTVNHHLVHVGVCELLSRQAAGSLKVRGRILQCNRCHLSCQLLLERKARCPQGMTYLRSGCGQFHLESCHYCLHTPLCPEPFGEHIRSKLIHRPLIVPLLSNACSSSRPNACLIFWILWSVFAPTTTAFSGNISHISAALTWLVGWRPSEPCKPQMAPPLVAPFAGQVWFWRWKPAQLVEVRRVEMGHGAWRHKDHPMRSSQPSGLTKTKSFWAPSGRDFAHQTTWESFMVLCVFAQSAWANKKQFMFDIPCSQ